MLVLMRGHGSTVVGTSLRRVVYRAVYAEVNAKMQIAAHKLGTPEFLTRDEAVSTSNLGDQQIGRCWELWRREVDEL